MKCPKCGNVYLVLIKDPNSAHRHLALCQEHLVQLMDVHIQKGKRVGFLYARKQTKMGRNIGWNYIHEATIWE